MVELFLHRFVQFTSLPVAAGVVASFPQLVERFLLICYGDESDEVTNCNYVRASRFDL